MAVIPGLVVSTASSLGKATVSSFGKAAVSSLGKALQVVCSLLQDHVLVFSHVYVLHVSPLRT